jgi:hypothetical protein
MQPYPVLVSIEILQLPALVAKIATAFWLSLKAWHTIHEKQVTSKTATKSVGQYKQKSLGTSLSRTVQITQ